MAAPESPSLQRHTGDQNLPLCASPGSRAVLIGSILLTCPDPASLSASQLINSHQSIQIPVYISALLQTNWDTASLNSLWLAQGWDPEPQYAKWRQQARPSGWQNSGFQDSCIFSHKLFLWRKFEMRAIGWIKKYILWKYGWIWFHFGFKTQFAPKTRVREGKKMSVCVI